MKDIIQNTIDSVRGEHRDFREQLFEVEVRSLDDGCLALGGRVLGVDDLLPLRAALAERLPDLRVDDSAVTVLHDPGLTWLHVATNLSSMHREPTFNSELYGGLLYGWRAQVLEQRERWGFVRLENGYMGWSYLPYMSEEPLPEATHMVSVPASLLRDVPEAEAHPIGRIFAGSRVQVVEQRGDWARVQAYRAGWVPASDLRHPDEQPQDPDALRRQIVGDAVRLIGAPYVWGGATVGGIDCSGLAQLTHSLSGITIRRDADMQMDDGRPVEPPYQMGDLVFFGEQGARRRVTHVAVSLGGWQIIHSSRARNGVYIDDIQAVEGLRESFLGGASYLPE